MKDVYEWRNFGESHRSNDRLERGTEWVNRKKARSPLRITTHGMNKASSKEKFVEGGRFCYVSPTT